MKRKKKGGRQMFEEKSYFWDFTYYTEGGIFNVIDIISKSLLISEFFDKKKDS